MTHPIFRDLLKTVRPPDPPCRCLQCRAVEDQSAGTRPFPDLTDLQRAQRDLRFAEQRDRDAWNEYNRALDQLEITGDAVREARDALARAQVREERNGS